MPNDLSTLISQSPVPPRVLAGVAGVLLLVAGGRLYRLAVVLPGLLIGLGGGLFVGQVAHASDPVIAGLALVGGAGGALVCWFAERFAVIGAGLVLGLFAADLAWGRLGHGPAPWYLWPASALAGALVVPRLWRVALVPLTAALGAVAVTYAAGWQATPLVVVGLTAVGVVVQVLLGRKKKAEK